MRVLQKYLVVRFLLGGEALHDLPERRLRALRVRPDLVTKREEIGAVREFGGDVRRDATFVDHRRLDHLGPPAEEVDLRNGAIAKSVVRDRAETHVVGADLRRSHAIVAGGCGEGADDGIRAEELPRLAHMPLSVIEMDTVETEPGRQPEM